METPSSIRRVTRSQTLSASNNIPMSRKKEESEKVISRSRKGNKQERPVLFDISNDSPIVGLAVGGLETPFSVDKSSNVTKQTPGTGEALLRGQVETLLQKVEEDAVLPKLSFGRPSFPAFQGFLSSPAAALLAPTPANTPLVSNENAGVEIKELPAAMPVAKEQDTKIPQETDVLRETPESPESLVTRALLFDDSPGKSEISVSSELTSGLTFQGSCSDEKPEADDDASVWSIQVNASSQGDCEEVTGEVEEYEQEIEEEDGGLIDELCIGIREACVLEKGGIAEFRGRHTRFIYDSDDEIEGEEEVGKDFAVSPGVLCLKGMPIPEGKHLRFPEQEEEDEQEV